MKHQRQNLDIVFRGIQPEQVRDGLFTPHQKGCELNSRTIGREEYLYYAAGQLPEYSLDELENLHTLLCQDMRARRGGQTGIFHLLFSYGQSVLKLEQGVPVCRFEELLDWRDISYRLGQDIFTTAYLAWQDWRFGNRSNCFSWPAVIGTDNFRLQELLKQGISENHFHLNGSSQSFPLSWACMMNHPGKIYQFFDKEAVRKDMRYNLSVSVLGRASDYQMTWPERLIWAAWLRAALYRSFSLGKPVREQDVRAFSVSNRKLGRTEDIVQPLRFQGHRVRRPDGMMRCLDYALSGDDRSYSRLLAGERQLLYQGFYRYLCSELTELEADLFYLYLLLKSQFRGEIVQINGRVGFWNFSRYQDRKEHFWEDVPEYKAEGRRLAVGATLHSSQQMLSLEARIVPKKSPDKQYEAVFETDRLVYFAEHEQELENLDFVRDGGLAQRDKVRQWGEQSASYFYVLHFIKDRDRSENRDVQQMRNQKVRAESKKIAQALSAALRQSGYLRNRIHGIDAASFEIGCRPETFATEFRFMRSLSAANSWSGRFSDSGAIPQLRVTYHVGEDFLDIADGLRAIDEAVQFLELERGDRLGHALAMGVNPKRHYEEKRYQLLLPKQDRLDNLVWLLFRSVELGININVRLREQLRVEAEELLEYLYGAHLPRKMKTVSLQDYYESWNLRGDHPDCYQNPEQLDGSERFVPPGGYRSFMRRKGLHLDLWRTREELRYLCYLYHFNRNVKECGEEVVAVTVDQPYMDLMCIFQDQLQRYVGELGIMIECNPTSNYLIGTLRRYDEHPIFRFNSFGFGGECTEGQLSVSINTDDQGVFDTSLENEYALLACSMSKALAPDGTKLYSRDVIYQYLDHVRQMGNEQSFLRTNPRETGGETRVSPIV